jgi:hypothetical protein
MKRMDMKIKNFVIAMVVTCLATFAGCSKDGSLTRKIDGKWVANQFTVDGSSWLDIEVYFDVDKEGTFIFSNDGNLFVGDWSIDEQQLELVYPGGEGVVAYGPVEVYDLVEVKNGEIHFEGNVEGNYVIFKGTLEK